MKWAGVWKCERMWGLFRILTQKKNQFYDSTLCSGLANDLGNLWDVSIINFMCERKQFCWLAGLRMIYTKYMQVCNLFRNGEKKKPKIT